MRILFVGKRHDENGVGIEKKMTGEINGFKELGHEVSYIYARENAIILKKHDGSEAVVHRYRENWISIYWAYEEGVKKVFDKYGTYFDMCYIRKTLCSPFHFSALKKIKKYGVKIIEEIPTYPYDDEMLKEKGIKSKIYFGIEVLGRRYLKKYVDFFTTFSEDKEIFGVKTICISNGIDCNVIPLKQSQKKVGEDIRLITVSTMQFWHGYDRLIAGLEKYYKNERQPINIFIDMVGDGIECSNLKKQVEKAELNKYVKFHGMKSGEELTDLYNQSDLGVSSLGLHRLGLDKAAPLKTREYIARGIPVIYSGSDLNLKKGTSFSLNVPVSEEAIDMNEVIAFYNRSRKEDKLEQKMREFAENTLTWKHQMAIVLNAVGD